MTAEILLAYGSIFTAVTGFIIAVYTMRTTANKDLVQSLQKRLDDEIKLRQDEREEFRQQLKDIAQERDALRKMLEDERSQWRLERDNLMCEIEELKRRMNRGRPAKKGPDNERP